MPLGLRAWEGGDRQRPASQETCRWATRWSVTARYNPLRPLYLIALGDDAGTKLYGLGHRGVAAVDPRHHRLGERRRHRLALSATLTRVVQGHPSRRS